MSQDECRAFCDSEFDHGGWQPDFISAIGSMIKKFLIFFFAKTIFMELQIILCMVFFANKIVREI